MSARDEGAEVVCPCCFQQFWLAVDPSAGRSQRFVSDCEICCRPIVFHAGYDEDGRLTLDAAAEDPAY